MKVAIILTGHLRCWEMVFSNFKEKFIDRYNPDIFIHSWDEEGWWQPSDVSNIKGYYDDTPKIDQQKVIDFYKPKDVVFENWDDYNIFFEERGKSYPNFAHRPKNILSMFYKLNKGVRMFEEHLAKTGESYDLVFRMRPDMIFEQHMPDFDSSKFYTLAHRNHMGRGTGDMFHVGNTFNMLIFSKISCFLTELYKVTEILCPHVMSEIWLKELKLPWNEIFLPKRLQHTPKGEYVEVDK